MVPVSAINKACAICTMARLACGPIQFLLVMIDGLSFIGCIGRLVISVARFCCGREQLSQFVRTEVRDWNIFSLSNISPLRT